MSFSTHFELIGGSSVPDHGRFVYQSHIGDLPFHDAPESIQRLSEAIRTFAIDAIYPTMDAVAETLQNAADQLPCRIIGSSRDTTRICASKRATYSLLSDVVVTPKIYPTLSSIDTFPVFIKPDRGYGSRNAKRADSVTDAESHLARHSESEMLILEHLPGEEWTIDCFTDRTGTLRFHGVRGRNRINNGISVNTSPNKAFSELFARWAAAINDRLTPRGAWFFQAKRAANGLPCLLEVAARFAGSSGLQRGIGVNLPLLSAFDAFDMPVQIAPNAYEIELDRALENRFRIDLHYRHVYVDLDDCLLIRGKLNYQLVAFLHLAIDQGCTLTLVTRHGSCPESTLSKLRIREIFDHIVHLADGTPKSTVITHSDAIFIDDSFRERADVAQNCGIPVFSPDMIECLM